MLGINAKSIIELSEVLDQGFTVSCAERVIHHLGLPLNAALKIMGVSPTTFHSYRREERLLRPETSRALYELASLAETAEAYFEEDDAAHRWLRTPSASFGGKTPLEYAGVPGGAAYVETLLHRLEHGVYS
ncbi:antitoxin [Deinococcus malanensis]|uniref:Antitoxin n=1 Tax=Deinococcus malanensis TaxID=1706855 RepID=A0ABQ2F4H8_9DEIO|nr:antitoxin [Deinococcus malanensis]